jgi:hypothetical protein
MDPSGIALTTCLTANELTVRIADLTVAMCSDDPTLPLGTAGTIESFLVSSPTPDTRLLITYGEETESSRRAATSTLFDSRAVWQVSNEEGRYRYRFTSPLFGAQPYKIATFSRDFTHGTIVLNRSVFPDRHTVYPLEYPLDELILLNLLARGRGVEVHAFGVIDTEGNGSLFLGQSGAGKTTMARIWETLPGITILSDDRIILRKIGASIQMYGTPWHGEARLAHPGQAPLRHLYFLKHGRANELIRQSTCEVVSRMFACSFPLFHNAEALNFTLGFMDEVAGLVPAYELRFLPDRRVLDLLPHA